MNYELRQVDTFEKNFSKLPKDIIRNIKPRMLSLRENPFIGKPLGYSFLRELKINKYRIYYYIYEEYNIVLFTGVSDKKIQSEEISKIKKFRKYYNKNLENFKYLRERHSCMTRKTNSEMLEEKNRLLKEKNDLLKQLVDGLEDIKHGRIKPFE